ncbi:DUF2892 domain-containing protein [Bdellovibrio bacteriovorus]|uniref:Putative transmembrane protein n=1 Tax=Bdellovibrio bacteriovorus (strain ATCC 15356 / DSM 50701 / NCIMB 9529 / HD100) TaxID=264462 RepID=Q6MIA6_BDEBA|nr:DUF2892 domain-containing protein [Bdellovibrio bacteriovorus]AHZ83637.1 membrane protein [Bdellovibrio bacteriovorus]BEV69607.1 hypothetical protein Bb109J_c3027 [Bdellovibrio bacteriovorus]CAE78074.1 putative transmembrane protein [Bdellovibrio bacteriovorus HD100]
MSVFSKNEGSVDRTLRIVVGLGLISLAFVGPANPWFLLGTIPLVTGLVGWCPAYQIFGLSTCQHKKVMKM